MCADKVKPKTQALPPMSWHVSGALMSRHCSHRLQTGTTRTALNSCWWESKSTQDPARALATH
jgi:hypothetical protein